MSLQRGVLLLLALSACVAAQSCSDISAISNGAKADGKTNDAAVFAAMNSKSSIGLIYMPKGTYLIGTSITISKPILADYGAIFKLSSGVTLSISNQPEHPIDTFFSGSGRVDFLAGTVRAFPEWWGAVGDGTTDDAAAIQAAYRAVSVGQSAMLYFSSKTYAIGSELVFGITATIMSETGARLKAIGAATRGVRFTEGGATFKMVLPHLTGFSSYCLNLAGTDLAALQLQTLSNCGDAIRLTVTPGSDINNCLDNTIWFTSITNSLVGIAFRAASSCAGPSCVIQGNQFIGNTISGGPASIPASAIGMFYGGSFSSTPAWDSNQWNIGTVSPPASNTRYAVVRAEPLSNRAVIKIGSIDALANGASIFAGEHNIGQYTLGLASALKEGGLGLVGQLNLLELSGQLTPASTSTVITAMTSSNTKAKFNGGKALVGNFFSLKAIPATDWAAGTTQTFYIYSQLATKYLYQIKCSAPVLKATGLPALSCTQVQDNSATGTNVKYEVALTLINMSGATVKASGPGIPFSISVATLGGA